MTVKVNSDGDFVENVHTELSSNVMSASYDILNKDEHSVGTLAHEVRKALDIDSDSDDDLAKWCDAVTSLQIADETDESDGSLGRMFWRATDYSASEFNKLPRSNRYEGLPTAILSETELAHQKDEIVKAGIVSEDDEIHVPLTKDGDIIPIIAVSDDRDESHPTFDEAKETLDQFRDDYFGEVETTNDSASSENNDSDSDGESDSDRRSVSDPTQIEGIGSKTIEKLESNGFDVSPALDVSEHIEVERFSFESDTEEQTGMPSPSEIKDLMDEGWTKDEIKDFYGE